MWLLVSVYKASYGMRKKQKTTKASDVLRKRETLIQGDGMKRNVSKALIGMAYWCYSVATLLYGCWVSALPMRFCNMYNIKLLMFDWACCFDPLSWWAMLHLGEPTLFKHFYTSLIHLFHTVKQYHMCSIFCISFQLSSQAIWRLHRMKYSNTRLCVFNGCNTQIDLF